MTTWVKKVRKCGSRRLEIWTQKNTGSGELKWGGGENESLAVASTQRDDERNECWGILRCKRGEQG